MESTVEISIVITVTKIMTSELCSLYRRVIASETQLLIALERIRELEQEILSIQGKCSKPPIFEVSIRQTNKEKRVVLQEKYENSNNLLIEPNSQKKKEIRFVENQNQSPLTRKLEFTPKKKKNTNKSLTPLSAKLMSNPSSRKKIDSSYQDDIENTSNYHLPTSESQQPHSSKKKNVAVGILTQKPPFITTATSEGNEFNIYSLKQKRDKELVEEVNNYKSSTIRHRPIVQQQPRKAG